ncbi:MAG: protocatechuate 3,4-dioxygenase [Deltaproteobacteria bacterium]|nr:MAG: protocatechuate 3,4-dioxygenase [Deltaproteobacteria bacterium]
MEADTYFSMFMKSGDLKKIFVFSILSVFFLAALNAVAGEQFRKTPADYEGPFYPVTQQEDVDNDLVHVKGHTGTAQGDILNLSGVVVNTRGDAQENLVIEIWQTDPQGRYKHPGDSSPGERDPDFQYWGAAVTGPDGTFSFKTVVPGAYQPRPAHIHYKVLKDGKVLLTSQIYFMEPSNRDRPSKTSRIELQRADLKQIKKGEFEAFFRIVL